MTLNVVLSKPERMFKARIVSVKDEIDKVLLALHAAEALHVKEVKELRPIEKEIIEKKKTELEELLKIVDRFLGYVKKEHVIEIKEKIEPYTIPELLEKYGEPVKQIFSRLQILAKKLSNTETLKEKTSETLRYLELVARKYPTLKLRDMNYEGDVVFSKTIVLPVEREEDFMKKVGGIVQFMVEELTPDMHEKVIVIVGLKRDFQHVKLVLRDLNIKILDVPSEVKPLSEYVGELKEKLKEYENEYMETSKELEKLIEENLNQVIVLRIILENEVAKLSVLEKAVGAKYISVIEGWVPESLRRKLLYELHNNVKYFYISFTEPGKEETPPTKMKNLKILNYFEPLVKFYGVPKYTEWDPTPIVAYSFAVFFGIMLGDVVYGLALFLAVRYVLDKLVENPESENYLLFKRMLYVSSAASVAGGILFGSYMGDTFSRIGIKIPPLTPELINPLNLIIASMIIGLVHVNVAHFLGFIRAIKERDKVIIANKIGLFLIQIFGIPYVLYTMINYPILPIPGEAYEKLIYGVFVGIGFLAYSQFLAMRFFGTFMWIFDITGLLGDVMSYTRLAGVSLATVYLASSFNLMCEMIINGINSLVPGIIGLVLGGIAGAAVFGIGHLLNFVLGIIGPFIHALRLCFVEFLPKFYEGGGEEYSPLKLIIRRRLVIRPS